MYRMHVMKPARAFYDIIVQDQQVTPSEFLFIDDLAINIEGARAAGMQAIQFERYSKIRKRFEGIRRS